MRSALRTVPATAHRFAGPLSVLLAVLLALARADAVPMGPNGPVPAPTAAGAGPRPPDTGHRADAPSDSGFPAQARTRYGGLAEHPHPHLQAPDHKATPAQRTAAVPRLAARTPVRSACLPVSPGRSAHDRGRAPPAPTST
ncbi:hypothetical protein [Streptomyces glaucescens]|uniref:hypothetical protein n=1 Tax=Streptomyces glaucescens TaxID=1907 RepID=UPI000A39FBBA|nr:hypothetical protein [Streptomyces glaucescens]